MLDRACGRGSLGEDIRENAIEPRHNLRLIVGEVRGFAWVRAVVVEFGNRCADVLVLSASDRGQLAPAHSQSGVESLCIQRVGVAATGVDQAAAINAVNLRRDSCSQQSGNGRKDIHQTHRLFDYAPCQLTIGDAHDPGHMQRGVVRQKPVLIFVVFPQSLAVIGDEDDECVVQERARLQVLGDLRDHGIDVRDLAIVGRSTYFDRNGSGGVYGVCGSKK